MTRSTIQYSNKKEAVSDFHTDGFFEGWPNPPSNEVLVRSILNAQYVTLAIDPVAKRLVGYITALSDDTLSAYIPFLEVLPAYRKQGIGHTLVESILAQLQHLYMVDLVCDKELADFYEEAGFVSWHAMIRRNYANQNGNVGELNNRTQTRLHVA